MAKHKRVRCNVYMDAGAWRLMGAKVRWVGKSRSAVLRELVADYVKDNPNEKDEQAR